MRELRQVLKILLRQNARERHRNRVLLREAERKIEDQFAKLDSLQSANEFAAIKFRKSTFL